MSSISIWIGAFAIGPQFSSQNYVHSRMLSVRVGSSFRGAANLAAQFIRIGVRAVVAAGWMVEDQAAQTFAAQFYKDILSGVHFGQAALSARRQTHDHYPGFNTWGAYQCYGDPDYTPVRSSHHPEPAHRSVDVPETICLHAPSEAIAELRTLAIDAAASPGQAEGLRKRLEALVRQLPSDCFRLAVTCPGLAIHSTGLRRQQTRMLIQHHGNRQNAPRLLGVSRPRRLRPQLRNTQILACNLDCRHAARSANQRHAASSHVCDCLGIPHESGPWAAGIIIIQDFGRFPISIETDGDGLVRGILICGRRLAPEAGASAIP